MFIREFYDRSAVVVAPSEFAADLLRLHGLKRPVEAISNGVPDAFFEIKRSKAKDGSIRILSVGRLAKEKRQEKLIEAVAASPHRDRIELTLAGVGPCEGPYKALAERLGVRAAVGPVSDEKLMALYAGADLFVHSSGVELEGMSVLEAMAAGLPVMVSASEDSALTSLVNEESRFHPLDVSGLSEKIDRWLADPKALEKRGAANRREARRFAHSRSVDALIKTYKLALDTPKR
jgi:glycosyltransferase involved in cell wall biosynthesis